MSIFGTKDVKTSASSVTSTPTKATVTTTTKKDEKKEEKKEINDYSNKGSDVINENLAAVIELFDKANKNVIIHNMKVTGAEDENVLEELKNSIDEKFAKINKRLDEMESANKASMSQRVEDLEAKMAKVANENQERIISTMESSMLATKTEVLKTIKENAVKKSGIAGYIVTAIIVGAATAAFFLSGNL